MTIAAYNSQGTPASGTTGAITPGIPTHSAGQLLLLLAEGDNTNFGTAPSGWTALPVAAGNATKCAAWWKIAASSSETNPTITPTSANHTYAVVLTFDNANQTTPIFLIAILGIGSNLARCPGGQTVFDDALIVQVTSWNVDNAGPAASAEANADLGSLTERFDSGTVDGNGGGLIVYTGTKTTAGAFVDTTYTDALAAGHACLTLAIAPIADKVIAGTVTINGSPAADGQDVRAIDITQPAASCLCTVGVTSGGTGAFTINAPYTTHSYQAVYEDGSSYGASAVDVAV